jgi:hypothetical protein
MMGFGVLPELQRTEDCATVPPSCQCEAPQDVNLNFLGIWTFSSSSVPSPEGGWEFVGVAQAE